MSVTLQLDIFTASQSSAKFLSNLLSILSQHNIHLQAVFAFEALGTLLSAPSLLIDQAILILGGTSDVRTAELYSLFGWRRQDLAAYLRKSSGCVRSFLLFTALKGVGYDEVAISEVLVGMLSSSGLGNKFPCASKQIQQLLFVLEPRTQSFLADVASAKLRLLCIASDLPSDVQGSLPGNSVRLLSRTMGMLLTHAFEAIRVSEEPNGKAKIGVGGVIELRGSVGLFDLASILLWLAPDKFSMSLRVSSTHPDYRDLDFGEREAPLLIQTARNVCVFDSKGMPMEEWQRIPWSSAQMVARDALGWLNVAQPLMGMGGLGKMGGVVSGVALGLAGKWVG